MDQRALLSKLCIRTGQRMKTLFPFTVSRKCSFAAFVFLFFFSLNKNPQHFNVFLKWKRFEMYTSRLKEGQCFHSVLSGEATQGFYFGPQTLSI